MLINMIKKWLFIWKIGSDKQVVITIRYLALNYHKIYSHLSKN